MDLFGPLPRTRDGYKYILVTMDQFSKLTKLFSILDQKRRINYAGIDGRIFRGDRYIKGNTDKDGQFITNRWREFGREHGIEIRHTSPYNPQSNPVERIMRKIG